MKFHCPQEELAKALAVVSHGIASNNTLPVLDNILIKAHNGTVTFIATDLEVAIEAVLQIPVDMDGDITVPAKLLTSYINLLPEGQEVTCTVSDGTTLEVQSTGSQTKIKGLSAKDYPALPVVEGDQGFTVVASQFVKHVQRVLFSASQNASRPILAGVCLHGEGTELKLVATDSYRLSEATLHLESSMDGGAMMRIVPAKTMQDVVRIFQKESGTLEVRASANQILVTNGSIRIISRLIEGRFPEYTAIIPKKQESSCTVTAAELLQATKRVNLFAKENSCNIRLETNIADGTLTLTTDSTQIGEEQATITAECSGSTTKIALNARYLIDALSYIGSDRMILQVDTPLAPAMLRIEGDEDYFHIIMPLKLNQ